MEMLTSHGPFVAYVILFLGSLVEGESFVLVAGFLAYQGFLSLPIVVSLAFVGSVSADQLLFLLGKAKGMAFLEKRPKWQKKTRRVFELLKKYNLWFIISFRFIYGIRTISPLVIGAADIPSSRFVPLNILAGFFWACLSCGLGYGAGYMVGGSLETIETFLKRFQIFFLIVLVLGVLFFLRRHWIPLILKKRKKSSERIDVFHEKE